MADTSQLQTIAEKASSCQRCRLHETRTQVVWADGNPQSRIVLVGEGPGQQEDEQGKPFVGAAGQLLDNMLAAIQLDRSQVYITNVVKCRPPENRNPEIEEISSCLPYLRWQVHCVQPQYLICLGAVAARTIIEPNFSVTQKRGEWIKKGNLQIMATYHPAALLRDPSKKREVWEDLQKLRQALTDGDIPSKE